MYTVFSVIVLNETIESANANQDFQVSTVGPFCLYGLVIYSQDTSQRCHETLDTTFVWFQLTNYGAFWVYSLYPSISSLYARFVFLLICGDQYTKMNEKIKYHPKSK